MSEQNHPNLNAVGFLTDIFEALENRVRGKAACFPGERIFLIDEIKEFVDRIDDLLDRRFGD